MYPVKIAYYIESLQGKIKSYEYQHEHHLNKAIENHEAKTEKKVIILAKDLKCYDDGSCSLAIYDMAVKKQEKILIKHLDNIYRKEII